MSLEKIQQNINNSNNINLFYLRKENQTDNWQMKIKAVTKIESTEDLKNKVKTIINNYLSIIRDNRSLITFKVDDNDNKNHYYELPVSDIINFTKLKDSINSEKNDDIQRLKAGNVPGLNPNIYIMRILNDGNEYLLFKSYSPASLIKRHVFLGLEAGGLDSDNFISIQKNIDCLYDSETEKLYIFSKSNFETIFNYKEDYKKKALLILREIKYANILTNFDIFESECKRLEPRIKKLARIMAEKKLQKLLNNYSKLEQIKEDFKTEIIMEENKIVIDTKVNKAQIDAVLELLDLPYWKNAITEEKQLGLALLYS